MPPISFSIGPSLALGLLKGALLREKISCIVDYADVRFNSALGTERLKKVSDGSMTDFLGEYVFNGPAGIESACGEAEILALHQKKFPAEEVLERMSIIHAAQKLAWDETERTARRILSYRPKIVGASSCFQQRNAAIAILKRIKELAPEVVTMMGGANCFGRAGLALLRTFPFIDYVFFGESDDIFAQVCRQAMEHSTDPLPYGVLRNGEPLPEEPPHRIVEDLNQVPYPEYDDYFQLLATDEGRSVQSLLAHRKGREGKLILYMEGSRGCWWGEKHPCTFCGLHGKIRTFRKKSPERVLAEMQYLSTRYGLEQLYFSDCVMPPEWFSTLLPCLKASPKKLHLYMELRSSLTPEQIRLLAEAGFDYVQPGIESLSDHELRLMGKGVSLLNNLVFLKFAQKYAIKPSWNLLFGFPGETEEDYRQQLALIPLIEHYTPPNSCNWIVYARDNAYASHPEKYGLRLHPSEIYRYQCPDDEAYIEDVALYYDAETCDCTEEKRKLIREMRQTGVDWLLRYQALEGNIRLDQCAMEDGSLLIIDTRACAAVRAQLLIGAERAVYLACERPVSFPVLLRKLSDRFSEAELADAVVWLNRKKLLLRYGAYFFALAVPLEREEVIQREIREFRFLLRKNGTLYKQYQEELQRRSDQTGALYAAARDVVTAFAKKRSMFFTGEEYLRYLNEECGNGTRLS